MTALLEMAFKALRVKGYTQALPLASPKWGRNWAAVLQSAAPEQIAWGDGVISQFNAARSRHALP